jgi:hypothetical protein
MTRAIRAALYSLGAFAAREARRGWLDGQADYFMTNTKLFC